MQVLTMIVSEYVLLMMPERFWLWYSVMVPVLLLMRYPDYRQRKWLLFYFDFCYYVQVKNNKIRKRKRMRLTGVPTPLIRLGTGRGWPLFFRRAEWQRGKSGTRDIYPEVELVVW